MVSSLQSNIDKSASHHTSHIKDIKSQLTGRAETVIVGEVLANGVGKIKKVVPLVLVDDLDWLFGLVKWRGKESKR